MTLLYAKTGLLHLEAAINSSVEKVKDSELSLAHEEFFKLISLNPNGITNSIENKELICIGYWGSFIYFFYNSDIKNSLCFMYECFAKYPLTAIKYFPTRFLNDDYPSQISNLRAKIAEAESEEKNLSFLTRHSEELQEVGKNVATVAVAAAGAIASGLTKQRSLAIAGKQAAMNMNKSIQVKTPEQIQQIRTRIRGYENEITQLADKISSESNEKIDSLNKYNIYPG